MAQPLILSAKRTPLGRFLGGLSRVPAPDLGALAIEAITNSYSTERPYSMLREPRQRSRVSLAMTSSFC